MLNASFSKLDVLGTDVILSREQSHKVEMTKKAMKFCCFLESNGITYDYCFRHPEAIGCVDYHRFESYLDGDYFIGKHLLLQERKGDKNKFLVITDSSKQVDLNDLREKLDCRKLEFVGEEEMKSLICTTPGNVSIFHLMYDTKHEIQLVIDQELLAADEVAFHPLYNGMSIFMKPDQCFKFLSYIDRVAMVLPIASRGKVLQK